MCLAVPARVVELLGDKATVDMEGIRKEISVLLVPDIRAGDYVIVHAGFAIGKLDEHEALESLKLIRQMFECGESGQEDGQKNERELKQ